MKKIPHLLYTSILAISTFSTASATVLINEIDYDQDGTDTAEFIELFNSGSDDVSLDNYRLDLINGGRINTPAYLSFDLTGYSLAMGDYLVICGNTSTVMNCDYDTGITSNMIQNGAPDGIALYHGNTLIDALTYEGVITGITEGSAGTLADKSSDIMSIGRLLDSQDTNNNATDFERGCITPGTANISGNGNCAVATTGTVSLPPIMWLFVSGFVGMMANTKGRKVV